MTLRSKREVVNNDYLVNRNVFENIANFAVGWIGSLFVNQEMNEKYSLMKELIFLPIMKTVMEAFLKYLTKECELNHDQLLVLHSSLHCTVNHMEFSFPYLVRKAGNEFSSSNITTSTTDAKNNIPINTRSKTANSAEIIAVGLILYNLKDSHIAHLEDYMVSEGHVVRTLDKKILKIFPMKKSSKTEKLTPKKPTGLSPTESSIITDVDIARLKLKCSISQLEKRVAALDAQAAMCRDKAVGFKVRQDYLD
jgi:hypothetical protein